MSANSYTTASLLSDILLLGHVPTGNNTFDSSDLLRLSTLELQLPITKQILSTRGNYYLEYQDTEIVDSGLYVIPSDAVAGALYNVELIQDQSIIPVALIDESEQYSTISPTSTSYGCFMKGNYVQILPTPNIGTVRLWFLKRTSDLVLENACGQVTAINGAVITVLSLPSTFLVGTDLDILGDQPPFNILATRQITDVTGTDVTLDSAVTDLAIGDWLALEGQTCVPQIPVEFRLLLAQRVVCKIYELQGYAEKMKMAETKLKEYEESTLSLITTRVQTKTKVINPVNGGFFNGNPNKVTNFPASRNS